MCLQHARLHALWCEQIKLGFKSMSSDWQGRLAPTKIPASRIPTRGLPSQLTREKTSLWVRGTIEGEVWERDESVHRVEGRVCERKAGTIRGLPWCYRSGSSREWNPRLLRSLALLFSRVAVPSSSSINTSSNVRITTGLTLARQ